MNTDPTAGVAIEPVAATAVRGVQVLESRMEIHDLSIDRPKIVAYLQSIPADKQEIALLHALEVGITEVLARRERFEKH